MAAAPKFLEMVREHSKDVTLGEAKAFAATLPKDKQGCFSGCYTVRSPSCPGVPLYFACPLNVGCCLWYNWFFCACPSGDAGAYSCTDNKGITYYLVKVDDKGTLGWFSDTSPKDDLKVSCYCDKGC
jgi:hypothetical protein